MSYTVVITQNNEEAVLKCDTLEEAQQVRHAFVNYGKCDSVVIQSSVDNPENTGLCKDCRFYRGTNLCHSPNNGTSPLDGESIPKFATANRYDNQKCGKSASWFSPRQVKPSMFARLVNILN